MAAGLAKMSHHRKLAVEPSTLSALGNCNGAIYIYIKKKKLKIYTLSCHFVLFFLPVAFVSGNHVEDAVIIAKFERNLNYSKL